MDGDSKYTDYNEINSKGFFTYVQCRKGEECVVLKGLKEEYQKKIYQEAVKKEFAIGQKLNHAGIIKYLDLVETDKYGICIELEYVEGRSLKAFYKEQHSVSLSQKEDTLLTIQGRHDPCVALRAVPVIEAVTALVILDFLGDIDHELR